MPRIILWEAVSNEEMQRFDALIQAMFDTTKRLESATQSILTRKTPRIQFSVIAITQYTEQLKNIINELETLLAN